MTEIRPPDSDTVHILPEDTSPSRPKHGKKSQKASQAPTKKRSLSQFKKAKIAASTFIGRLKLSSSLRPSASNPELRRDSFPEKFPRLGSKKKDKARLAGDQPKSPHDHYNDEDKADSSRSSRASEPRLSSNSQTRDPRNDSSEFDFLESSSHVSDAWTDVRNGTMPSSPSTNPAIYSSLTPIYSDANESTSQTSTAHPSIRRRNIQIADTISPQILPFVAKATIAPTANPSTDPQIPVPSQIFQKQSLDTLDNASLRDGLFETPISDRDTDNDSQIRDPNQRIQEQIDILKELLAQAMKTRSLLYELRGKLRIKRLAMSTSDGILTRFLQEALRDSSGIPDQNQFLEIITQVNEARNAYGPLEDEYDQLEARLDAEEWRLSKAGKKLQRMVTGLSSEGDDDDRSSRTSFEDFENNDDDFGHFEDNQPSLYDDLLANINELEEAQTNYHKSKVYLKKLEQQPKDSHISAEAQQNLYYAIQRQADARAHLQNIRTEVDALVQECIESGLFAGTVFENCELADSSLSVEALQTTEYNDFPLLHQQSEEEYYPLTTLIPQDAYYSFEILTTYEGEEKGGRIASWMLHKLRCSIFEVGLLRNASEPWISESWIKRNPEEWQELVLSFWYLDASVSIADAPLFLPTLTKSQRTAYSEASLKAVTEVYYLDSPADQELIFPEELYKDWEKDDFKESYFEKPSKKPPP